MEYYVQMFKKGKPTESEIQYHLRTAGGAKTDDAIYKVLGYIDETGYHSLKK